MMERQNPRYPGLWFWEWYREISHKIKNRKANTEDISLRELHRRPTPGGGTCKGMQTYDTGLRKENKERRRKVKLYVVQPHGLPGRGTSNAISH